ncbi:MAG: hypothetical protein DRQ78_13580 [Epsilonproteobacteria bacterium]|nr:MAG: hypothetical protein DRQ78_13580 [Campylobacterota bacterium]
MGGKGASYSGPSAYEIEQQNKAYRSQWDMEAKQKEINQELEDKQKDQEEAQTEVRGRQGVKDTFGNSQIGFTRKDKPTEDDFMEIL